MGGGVPSRGPPVRTPGLALRLTISHFILVLATLGAFVGVTGFIVNRQAEVLGAANDRATAQRLAPWFFLLHEQRGNWTNIQRIVPTGPPQGLPEPEMPHPRRRMMEGPDRGEIDRGAPVLAYRQPIILRDRLGRIVGAWNVPPAPVPAEILPEPFTGVPVGPADRPVGYLYVGSMAFPSQNPIREYLARAMGRAAAVTAVILLVFGGAGAWLWSRRLVRPILELSVASERIGGGDYATRVRPPGDGTGYELRCLAEQFNRMAEEIESQEAARRRFVADAAHELRTPLSLVATRIELLREGVYRPDEEQWALLTTGVDRMKRLVTDLQVLARLDAGRFELRRTATELSSWLAHHLEEYRPILRERDIPLVTRMWAEPLPVLIDPDRFRQIIDNILSNAIRYSPRGAPITVTTMQVGSEAELEIADGGPGIAEEDRDRIFQRFVRLDEGRSRNDGGSGLGLAIAAELVTRHGGSIGVRGAPGARFYLRIPLKSAVL